MIVPSLALNREQIAMLKDIPAGTRALLVNFDNRTCMHTITCIYEAGIRDLELFPYYGEGDYDRSIQVAITPNEEQLVPAGITCPASLCFRKEEEVLALGDRETLYLEEILPAKMAYNCQYVENLSVKGDIRILLRTARMVLFPR